MNSRRPKTPPVSSNVLPFRPRTASTPAPREPGGPPATVRALRVQPEVLHEAGAVATCDRCGAPCKVAETADPSAQMLRHSRVPVGSCLCCAVAEWFVTKGLRDTVDPQALLTAAGQAAFAHTMNFLRADGSPAEIDWARVVAQWGLPFVIGRTPKGKPRRKSYPAYDPEAARARQSLALGSFRPRGD